MNLCKRKTANCSVILTVGLILIGSTTEAPAGKFNPDRNIGDDAPAWKDLPGVDGKKHSLADLKEKEAVVIVFTCNSCPYAVEYEDRLIAFTKKYAGEKSKTAVVAINVNKVKEDLLPKMKERAKKKEFPFPYLFDESQQIARDYGALWTPEFFVLNKQRKIVYMGAMDDSTDASKVKQKYVEAAVKAVLAGEKPATEETVAVGCRVRLERKRRSRRKKK